MELGRIQTPRVAGTLPGHGCVSVYLVGDASVLTYPKLEEINRFPQGK